MGRRSGAAGRAGVAVLTAVTAVTLAAAGWTGFTYSRMAALEASLRPHSILELQFAFTPRRAAPAIDAWRGTTGGLSAATESLLLDFELMPGYAFLFAGLALLASRLASGRLAALGSHAALLPFGAWAFDAIENVALLRALMTRAERSAGPLAVAGIAASAKFLLLGLCTMYIVRVAIARLSRVQRWA